MATLHRPIIEGLVDILSSTFNDGRYVDKCIEYAFKKNRKWGSRDRKFIAEAAYDIVRWWRKLNFLCEQDFTQSSFTDLELKKIVDCWLVLNEFEASLRLADPKRIEYLLEKMTKRTDVESVTDWFDQVGVKSFGNDWEEVLRSLNEEARVWLRVNSLKSTASQVQEELKEEGVFAQRSSRNDLALVLEERKNVFSTKAFKSGHFEVQDLGSQMISLFADAKPGQRVIDACAGAGGKSLHMASLMKNKGKIIALDIHQWKLEELRRRSTRAGVDIIEVRDIADNKVIKRLKSSADLLLLDVPCTGSGVLRRNPDTKWKLSEAQFMELQETQRSILQDYSEMVKPGGEMVYSTCSLFEEENEAQVQAFLKQHQGRWELVQQKNLSPVGGLTDGFYMAKLKLTK